MDIFCNNAGILNEIEWQKTISINLVRKLDTPHFLCQYAWRRPAWGSLSLWCRSLPSGGTTWLWSTWAGWRAAVEGWSSTYPPWLVTAKRSYHLPEHLFKERFRKSNIILGYSTLNSAGIGPLPPCPVYTASKHGLVGFTRAVAVREWKHVRLIVASRHARLWFFLHFCL